MKKYIIQINKINYNVKTPFSMKRRNYYLPALVIFIFFFLIANIGINSSQKKEKDKKDKPASRPCCVLGLATHIGNSSVILEQICRTENSMAIYFHTKNMAGTCVHPPSTLLLDQNGKRYNLISSKGLPECSTGKLNEKPDAKFIWVFQPFGKDVKSFTLREEEDEVTLGMLYWVWNDVDVSHCRF